MMIGLQTIKKQFQKSLLLLSFALLLNPAMAQNNEDGLTVNVALDTNVIAIGDQIDGLGCRFCEDNFIDTSRIQKCANLLA